MLQYLIILLDKSSVSYCHYSMGRGEKGLIPLEILKKGILFSMKENLMVQFVYPNYKLPKEYENVIETIDNMKIAPASYSGDVDIRVFEDWQLLSEYPLDKKRTYVLRTSGKDFFLNWKILKSVILKVARLNVVFTNIDQFSQEDFNSYQQILDSLIPDFVELFKLGELPQLNILTDRMELYEMNNCNAGWKTITLAPNGKFYICPAFYIDDETDTIGSLDSQLDIHNPQLYRLGHAPICKICDAFQCCRCIYLNKKITLEMNTPSHEQCVVSHIERNASRSLLLDLRKYGDILPRQDIKEIDYMDPFESKKWY